MSLTWTSKLLVGSLLFACTHATIQAIGGPRIQGKEIPPGRTQTMPAKGTLWLIPHTHWEGAVFKTREEYLETGLPHILAALELLKAYPEYRFVLDQVAYVKPFLERYPEQEGAFRKFVSEGRLQIVGGNDVMLDVNMPSGESWVRQVLYGKGYFRDKLGVEVAVGWGLDTFGHHAQMPQLLKLAGYKSYWFQRGVHGDDTLSEFLWEGIDGTRIPAFWLPMGYGLFYPAPSSAYEFDGYAHQEWYALGRYSRRPDRVALAGADVSEPEESLPLMVHAFDRKGDAPFVLRFGVPTDFERVIAQRGDRPVVTGELNPVFQGAYSSRIELKQWLRTLEHALTTAETLGALASWLGTPTEKGELTRAWEPVLFNQAHDLMSGTMVDKVYEETLRGYQFSQSLGDELITKSFDAITSRIDTRGEGVPVIVFNSLGWQRTELAQVELGFSEAGAKTLRLADPAGNVVPIQHLETQRYGDGDIKHTKVAFIARDVPALGYSLYRIAASSTRLVPGQAITQPLSRSSSTGHEDLGSIENEYYRATFNLWTGEMTKLWVKSGDWDALGNGPANVIAREQDGGDFWELYGTLNGARLTAMTRQQGLPAPDRSRFSNEWVGGDGAIEAGQVVSEFHISHPFGNGSFVTTVRVYPGIRRIDFRTEILNNERLVRYRALFPTSIKNGLRFDEIPFGAVERPTAQEFPAQNWIDYSDGIRGVGLLNRGLPGNNVADGTLILSLMRSAQISAYPSIGGYEPGVSSDLGLELGAKRAFEYALVPHAGDWRKAEIYRAGKEFSNPLVIRKVGLHAGSLPKRWGLLEVSEPSVMVSALKPGPEDSVVLRVYQATGRPVSAVRIKLNTGVSSAREVDLLEAGGRELRVLDGTLQFDLGPYEIKTFKLKLRPWQGRQ